MRRTPLTPSRVARQKFSRPTPLGLTAPMPVTTTRRDIIRITFAARRPIRAARSRCEFTNRNYSLRLEDLLCFYLSASIGCFHVFRERSPAELASCAGGNPGGCDRNPGPAGISGARFGLASPFHLAGSQPSGIDVLWRIGLPAEIRRAHRHGPRALTGFVRLAGSAVRTGGAR